MARSNVHRASKELWELAARQHGVVTRAQLLALRLSRDAIAHRLATGRLHPVGRGVYAVGRPQLSRHGLWLAAVLACGPEAVLSHRSAAALWGIRSGGGRTIEVTVPPHVRRRRPGTTVYRRALDAGDRTSMEGIPATTVHRTLLDLAPKLAREELEAAINAADKHDLTDPERLRAALDGYAGRPGASALRRILDRRTFTLTDSELERRFLPIARRAGLPLPETGRHVAGFKVDFWWPDRGLVVETDGLRYHRTPAQQARDRLRDQAHTAAGLTPLRFTHAQVRYEPRYVQKTLASVTRRLRGSSRRLG
jgi:predicted transcriptional regulator of viral defense system/very-short-patch-repair endonuclease